MMLLEPEIQLPTLATATTWAGLANCRFQKHPCVTRSYSDCLLAWVSRSSGMKFLAEMWRWFLFVGCFHVFQMFF